MASEKRRAHYSLTEIKTQMTTVGDMNLTRVALDGIISAGMQPEDALQVIQSLSSSVFYKSMVSNQDKSVWQDVYHPEWCGCPLYVKISKHEEYFVISFKEK